MDPNLIHQEIYAVSSPHDLASMELNYGDLVYRLDNNCVYMFAGPGPGHFVQLRDDYLQSLDVINGLVGDTDIDDGDVDEEEFMRVLIA